MILRGFIDEIGVPREWTSKKTGDKCYTYPVTLSVPHINAKGEEKTDKFIADHMAGNPDYIARLDELCKSHTRLELEVSFSVREYNGKQYQNVTLWNAVVLIDK